MLAIRRTTAKTTTTSSSVKHAARRRALSDAQTQTSLPWNDKKGVGQESVADAPEVSHLEVPLSHFEDALFSTKCKLPHLDAVAAELLLSEEFQRTVQSYVEALEEDEEQSSMRPPGEDVEDLVIKIFTMIANSYPTGDTIRPYDIQFHDETHFAALPEPHGPPGVAGVFASNDSHAVYHWRDVAILFDNGMVFEEEHKTIATRRKRALNAHPSPTVAYKSTPRFASRPSGASVGSGSPAAAAQPRPSKRTRLDTQYLKNESDNSNIPPPPAVPSESTADTDSISPECPKPPQELARCALEALSTLGNRRHILGFTIHGLIMRFWYFDRAGTVYTTPLQLNDKSFVKAFIRLIFSDSAELGFENALQPPTTGLLSSQFNDVIGCTIDIQGSSFTIREKLHSAFELYGRGTTVYGAKRLKSGGPQNGSLSSFVIPEDVVIKLSWQLTDWGSEDALYRLAAEKGVHGISHLYRSANMTRLSRGCRRRLVRANQYRDRELRAQVLGPLAVPLYRVKQLSSFTAAFKSLVRGNWIFCSLSPFLMPPLAHHDLYMKTGVLHHDISPNNLMVDAKDHSIGVLIDLDLAVQLNNGEQKLPIGSPLGGTLPFRAIQVLLQRNRIRELYYRHDLESFFYALVWILTYYPLDFSRPVGDLQLWYNTDLFSIGNIKRSQLTEMRSGANLPDGPLKAQWLQKLAAWFDNGFKRMERGDAVNRETCEGLVTYDGFMSILDL